MTPVQRTRFLLLLSDTSWYFAEGMLLPLFASVTQKMGGSIFDIAAIYALYQATVGIAIIIIGYISDSYNKERFMLAGWFFHAAFTFGYIFMTSTTHLAMIQIGLGLADALSTPTWFSLYSRSEIQVSNGYFWGLTDGLENISLGIGILFGGIIVHVSSLNYLFFIMGCLHLLGTFGVYLLVQNPKSTMEPKITPMDL